jgi:hypothetical protein
MTSPGLKDGSKPDPDRNQSPDPKSGGGPH